MPRSRAVSTDATSNRTFRVSSSMSTTLTMMSPATTIPLSSTRSRMSASESVVRFNGVIGRP